MGANRPFSLREYSGVSFELDATILTYLTILVSVRIANYSKKSISEVIYYLEGRCGLLSW